MKKVLTDWKLIVGFILALFCIYFSFDQPKVFWYYITGTSLLLIAYSIFNEEIDDQVSMGSYLLYGIISGLLVYGVFWIGHHLIHLLDVNTFIKQVNRLYAKFAPDVIWHFVVLILIVIPAEELFWRGFIQKRLMKSLSVLASIIIASVLYASVYIFTDFPILIIASLCAGLIWGGLYAWKRSIPLVILSHVLFDLLLFIFLPLA